jgi:hypothetical protein
LDTGPAKSAAREAFRVISAEKVRGGCRKAQRSRVVEVAETRNQEVGEAEISAASFSTAFRVVELHRALPGGRAGILRASRVKRLRARICFSTEAMSCLSVEERSRPGVGPNHQYCFSVSCLLEQRMFNASLNLMDEKPLRGIPYSVALTKVLRFRAASDSNAWANPRN